MLPALCVLLPAIVVGAAPAAAQLEKTVIASGPISKVAGEWTVEGQGDAAVITHDATKWTAKEGYPLALFRNPREFANGTVSVQFKLVGGSDDYTAGLAFGRDGQEYYYVRYNTKDGNVALWRMEGPKRMVVKHGEHHEQLAKNEWHTLELTVDGRKIRARVNRGPHVVEHELGEAPVGQLGLWTKPDATTAFRNLRVRAR